MKCVARGCHSEDAQPFDWGWPPLCEKHLFELMTKGTLETTFTVTHSERRCSAEFRIEEPKP